MENVISDMFEETRVRGRVLVHAAYCRPDIIAKRVQLHEVTGIEGRSWLNKCTVAEAPSPKKDCNGDLGILYENALFDSSTRNCNLRYTLEPLRTKGDRICLLSVA